MAILFGLVLFFLASIVTLLYLIFAKLSILVDLIFDINLELTDLNSKTY